MADAVEGPGQRIAHGHVVDPVPIGGEHIEQVGQVRRVELACQIGLGKADVPGRERAADEAVVADGQVGVRARLVAGDMQLMA